MTQRSRYFREVLVELSCGHRKTIATGRLRVTKAEADRLIASLERCLQCSGWHKAMKIIGTRRGKAVL